MPLIAANFASGSPQKLPAALFEEALIREIKKSEHPILEEFLYEAIYQLDSTAPLQRNVIKKPEISVDKDNYAVKLYKNVGFEVIAEREHDFLMLLKLG